VGIINPMAIPGENRVSTGVASNGTVTLIPLAPSEQKIFDAVLQFYDEFGTLSPNVDLTPSPVMPSSAFTSRRIGLTALAIAQVDQRGYINAFDVVTTPVYREQVVNSVHYSTDPSFAIPAGLKASLSRIGTFISWLKMSGLPIISLPIDATVKYTFPDKSSIELVYTFDTNRYEYQRGTGKDSVGNPIAEVQSDLSGGPGSTQNMTFPPGTAGGYAGGRQIEHIRALGVSLGGSVPVNSSGYSIACTTSGGVTQCAIVKTSGM
jgi:hypothetical protein